MHFAAASSMMTDDHRDFPRRKSSNKLFTSRVPTAMPTRNVATNSGSASRCQDLPDGLCCRRALAACDNQATIFTSTARPQENLRLFLERDCLRKHELHCGSRIDENVASGDSTRPHFRGLRSRRTSRLDAVGLYRNIASVHRNRRKCHTQWRRSATRP
jgi:hypothetical protein